MSITKGMNSLKGVDFSGESGIILSNRRHGELAMPYPEHKQYLDKLKKYGDSMVTVEPTTFEEMGLLSRQTGNEFASITIDNNHILIRGDENTTPLPRTIISKKGKLNCHSHPYIGDVRPSPEDLDVAIQMDWQKEFYIISPDNKQSVYTSHGVTEIKDINRKMTSIEGIELYEKLFKED